MANERLHENEHNKCLVTVVTLSKKGCHHVNAAVGFLSQSTNINSGIQLGLITEHRLYQIVIKIIGSQLAGGGCFDITFVDS